MAAKKQVMRKILHKLMKFGKLESEELSLDDSISEYEKAIKLIKESEAA